MSYWYCSIVCILTYPLKTMKKMKLVYRAKKISKQLCRVQLERGKVCLYVVKLCSNMQTPACLYRSVGRKLFLYK